jgi:uncharacterized protein (UPF0276 family)
MNKDNSTRQLPYLGFGLGLRVEHYETLLENPGPVEWLEVISENYMIPGGRPLVWLEKFREPSASNRNGYPITCAGPACRV